MDQGRGGLPALFSPRFETISELLWRQILAACSRSTAVVLRCRDILPPWPGATPPDSGGHCVSPGR